MDENFPMMMSTQKIKNMLKLEELFYNKYLTV